MNFEALTGAGGRDTEDPPPPAEDSNVLIVLPVGVVLSLIVRLSEVSEGVTAGGVVPVVIPPNLPRTAPTVPFIPRYPP